MECELSPFSEGRLLTFHSHLFSNSLDAVIRKLQDFNAVMDELKVISQEQRVEMEERLKSVFRLLSSLTDILDHVGEILAIARRGEAERKGRWHWPFNFTLSFSISN
jgi:3-methyladenine DNA glycosylase/8-oxoguanine DNA glycosylase